MKALKINIHNYNLFYLFLCIVWVPLQRFYLHIDAGNRTLIVTSIVAIFLNLSQLSKTKLFKSKTFIFWILLVIYTFINYSIKSSNITFAFIFQNSLLPLVFMLVSIIELDHDERACLNVILIAQLVFLLIGVTHISRIQFERSSTEELGNALPNMAGATVFVSSVLLCKRMLKWSWVSFVLIIGLALFIIIVTATRKAFGFVLIVLIGVLLSYFRKVSFKSIIITLFLFIILYVGSNWVMDNTVLGNRIQENSELYDYPLVSNPKINSFLMTFLGDRSFQYYVGLQIFHKHPVTGIGLLNFQKYTFANSRLHTEYIVQLCENGLVGFFLLMMFYFFLIKKLFNNIKVGKIRYIYLFGLLAVLFVNFTAWTYNSLWVMFIYANIINFLLHPQKFIPN